MKWEELVVIQSSESSMGCGRSGKGLEREGITVTETSEIFWLDVLSVVS